MGDTMQEALENWIHNQRGEPGSEPPKIRLWTPGGYISGNVIGTTPSGLLILKTYTASNKEQTMYVVMAHIAAWA